MAGTAIWRWVILRTISNPGTWLLWSLLAGLVPLLQALTPVPPGGAAISVRAIEWIPAVALLGTATGVLLLSEGEEFLRRLPGRVRWSGESGALLASLLILQLPILAGALLASAAPLDLATSAPGILAVDVHACATALLLMLLPAPGPLRALLLVASTCFVPALLADSPGFAGALGSLLDVPARLHLAPRAAAGMLCPSLALALASHRLRVGPGGHTSSRGA